MSYRPITFCPQCEEAHDVYTEGLCENCKEVKAYDEGMEHYRK